MSQTEFVGMLVFSLLTLANLYFTIRNNTTKNDDKITDILITLNKYANNLDSFIKQHSSDYETLRKRVDRHGQEIDENREVTQRNENEIKHLKEDLKEHINIRG